VLWFLLTLHKRAVPADLFVSPQFRFYRLCWCELVLLFPWYVFPLYYVSSSRFCWGKSSLSGMPKSYYVVMFGHDNFHTSSVAAAVLLCFSAAVLLTVLFVVVVVFCFLVCFPQTSVFGLCFSDLLGLGH